MQNRMALIQKTAMQLLHNLNSESVLQNFLRQATVVFNATNASLLVVDEDDPQLVRLKVAVGMDADRIGLSMKITEGAIGEVYKTGKVFVIEDYRKWEGRIADPRFARLTTSISAPLRTGEKLIGILQLSWNDEVYPLCPAEINIFEQFSLLAAVAVESAKVFECVREEKAITDAIFDTLPGMIFLFDEHGRTVRWNLKLQELTGYSPDELLKMKSQDYFQPEDAELVANKIEQAFREGFADVETHIKKKDGSLRNFYLTAVPLIIHGKSHLVGTGIDITDRQQAAEALARSEEKFRNIIEASPMGMHLYTLNDQGQLRLIMANPTADRMLGVIHNELFGKTIEEAFPNLVTTNVPDLYRSVARGELSTQTFEIPYKDERIQGYYFVTAFRIAEGAVTATFMDISQRRQMEEELRQHRDRLAQLVEERTGELSAANEELTALNEEMAAINDELQQTNNLLVSEIDLRQNKEQELLLRGQQYRAATRLLTRPLQNVDFPLESILRDALQLVKAPAGYIGFYNETDNAVLIRQVVGPIDFKSLNPRPADEGMMGQVIATKEVQYIEDYRYYARRISDPMMDRLTSLISVPLKYGDRLIGILAAHWLDAPCPVKEEDIEVLRQYADLASAVLERDEIQTRITRKNELLQGLADTTSALLGELDLNTVLQGVLEKALALTGISHGFIHLFDKDSRQGSIRAGKGRYNDQIGVPADFRGGIFAEVIRTGKTVVVQDYSQWPGHTSTPNEAEVTLAMQAPLKIGGKLIGIIGLSSYGEAVSLDREKLDAVEHFAAIASIAVKNAINHDETRKLAYFDTLTGMANRASLNLWLEAEMVKVRKGENQGAVFFIDLDDLKTINDTFGHSFGDDVIIAASNHIRKAVDFNAFISRIGGDEFVVVWPGQSDRIAIGILANHLVQSLSQEYKISGERVHMSASIGVALYPEDGLTTDDILKNADSAMYEAKRSGRNRWSFYENTLQAETYEKMMLTNSLRKSLERNELTLHFQPKVRLPDKKIVGFEALLRWNSAEHGFVPPVKFIPFAEHSGIIVPIGHWVLREACRFAQQLAEKGRGDLQVAVNISPRQLSDENFIPMVHDIIRKSGVNSSQLEIEVTENVLIAAMEDSIQKLTALRNLGVNIALDDFGTGYSSLTYLRRLPVDTLKVDKSFIDGIIDDNSQADLVGSIIDMAHTLNLTVVAEGVETEAQVQKLYQYECDCIQGYVFSKPLPIQKALALLD